MVQDALARRHARWPAALAATAVLLCAPGTQAAAVFSTAIDLPGNSRDASDTHPFASALADSGTFFNGADAEATALAMVGKLGARASFSLPGGDPAITSSGAGASAGVRYDDVVFTHDANPADTSAIAISTNFFLDGFFVLDNGSDETRASAGVSVNYGLGTGLANAVTTIGGINRTRDHGALSASNSGVFQNANLGDDMAIHGVFTSTTLIVPVGVAVPLSLRIIVGTNGASRDGASVGAASNFLDTLTLATDRPVFNLPQGYSAHSLAARIVDNRVQVVPLPSTVYLLGAALLALFRPRRAGASPD